MEKELSLSNVYNACLLEEIALTIQEISYQRFDDDRTFSGQHKYYKSKFNESYHKNNDSEANNNVDSINIDNMKWTESLNSLGLNNSACASDIKKSYRRLIKLYHPDTVAHRGKDFVEIAHVKFIKIKEAYEYLISRNL